MIYIAQNIRYLRKLKKLNQEELGAQLNKTKGAVSSYEKNASYPSVEALVALAEFFEVSIDDLLLTDLSKNPAVFSNQKGSKRGLNREETLQLKIEMQKIENTLLRRQLEDLHKDKALQQEQIEKLWNLIEAFQNK